MSPRVVTRVIIADDEPLARERIASLLADRAGYDVVAECEDGAQAVDAILRTRPDLVFLDIKMPALDGLEVVEALGAGRGETTGAAPPEVVFVTAFDEFALRAFEVSAADYLLKPVDRERLDRALARVEARLAARRHGGAPGAHSWAGALDPALRDVLERLRGERAYPARFLVRAAHGLYFVRAAEVEWVDAAGNYVRLHARGKAHLVRDTMRAFESKLDPATFVRVHRSAIVNLDHVLRLEPYAHGEYLITLRDGTRLRSSRTHSGRLHELLK